jgi:putative inorganic carbon (HCO3(-)) transporter
MKITQYLAVSTIISLPLYVIRTNFGGIPTTFLEILLLVTVLSWALNLIRDKDKISPSAFLKDPYIWPAILLLIVGLVSVIISPDIRGALGLYKAYLVEPVLFYFVVVSLSQKTNSFRWLIDSVIFSGVWLSLLAIWQFFSGFNPFAPYEAEQGRVSAVYNSANSLALYLGPIFALNLGIVYEKLKEKRVFTKRGLFYLLSLILTLLAIYLTRSEGAMIGIAGVLGVFSGWFIYLRLGERVQVLLQRFLIGFLIVGVLAGGYFFLNISSFTPDEKFSYPRKIVDTPTIRLCLWEGTRDLLKDHYILGVGLGGFHDVYPAYRTCDNEPLMYPHNLFLNFWTELGLAGLFAFLWLVGIFMLKLKDLLIKSPRNGFSYRPETPFSEVGMETDLREKRRYRDGKAAEIHLGLFSSMIYILIHGLVDVPYFKNDLSAQFWLLLALSVIGARLMEKRKA